MNNKNLKIRTNQKLYKQKLLNQLKNLNKK
jgi:hypothetical protein